MAVIVTLQQVNLKGQIVPPNTRIRVDDEHVLVDKGYARRLTKDESRAIVSEYAAYAEKVFNEKPVVITSKKDKKQVKKIWQTRGLFEDA